MNRSFIKAKSWLDDENVKRTQPQKIYIWFFLNAIICQI